MGDHGEGRGEDDHDDDLVYSCLEPDGWGEHFQTVYSHIPWVRTRLVGTSSCFAVQKKEGKRKKRMEFQWVHDRTGP